jgi:hypothetical protein
MMQTVRSLNDLERYGIIPLTGEACGLTYRILFDFTSEGQKIIEKCLGLRLVPPESWNRGTKDNPHVGCILLSREMLVPLGVFALLESGCTEVWLYQNGSVLGIEPNDPPERIESLRQQSGEALVRTFAYRGTAGDRNVHLMSGRVT